MLRFEVELKEEELAGLLGVIRRKVVAARKGGVGDGQWRVAGGRDRTIWWTPEGCGEMAKYFGCEVEEEENGVMTCGVEADACGKMAEVEVARAYVGHGNWRMLRCRFVEGGEEVWVRTTAHFIEQAPKYRPGMRMKARWNGAVWCQDGAAPRFYGRW